MNNVHNLVIIDENLWSNLFGFETSRGVKVYLFEARRSHPRPYLAMVEGDRKEDMEYCPSKR
jgi:hypothetical protein